ncbi:MAG: hypothetical protein OFPII_11630 [Osedax symbiont Rs1]|nr:MAG: hypothetical protein OFPII_11630 [Osedax symbiont Rs1]
MIIKDKAAKSGSSAKEKAGIKQELDVAFYLRRAFKDHEQVFVFNDLKFRHNQETAQIDHLVFYPYGFVLIESKSITGEVKVNAEEEWTRSYNSKWQGMPSPIKQVELQQRLFREMLFEHKAEMLGKVLGLRQEGFGGRCWDNLCAVSSNAIIDRKAMPNKISKQIVKSEFLVEKLNSIMKLRNKILNAINIIESRPKFKPSEMATICNFILSQDVVEKASRKITPQLSTVPDLNITVDKTSSVLSTSVLDNEVVWQAPTDKEASILEAAASPSPIKKLQLTCKKCGLGPKLTASYGKYGYYTVCDNCSGNTSMKQACPSCKSKKTKVSKKREIYTLSCQECEVVIGLVV